MFLNGCLLARSLKGGMPAVIFDRQHLATGAQGIDRYEAMLRQLAGQGATQPAD